MAVTITHPASQAKVVWHFQRFTLLCSAVIRLLDADW
jgi:hypothetical protein